MHVSKWLGLTALVAGLSFAAPISSNAQVSINIGPEPNCPYGYYDYSPYRCAPSGFYGPEWFNGGVFVGAGRWYHGPRDFRGHVDNHFDEHHGYHGPYPNRGEHWQDHGHADFHGNEMRDGRGHSFDEHHR